MSLGLGLKLGLKGPRSSFFELKELVRSLGGSLYLPNVSNFENTTVGTGIDDPAELDDPIAYAGDLTTYDLPENMLINSVFAGAVAGSPGTMPTGWNKTASGSGLTTEITAASASSITIRVSGTANATTGLAILGRNSVVEIPAKPGEIWTFSCNTATVVASGSTPTGKALFSWAERTAAGSTVTSASLSYTEGRHIITKVISGATTERYNTGFNFFPVSGETYDFTITISNVQLERGRARTYVPTTTAAISRGTFNPAFQATTANKPLLRKGAKNLLTYSEDIGNASWVKSRSSYVGGKLIASTDSGTHRVYRATTLVNGPTYAGYCEVKAAEYTKFEVQITDHNEANSHRVMFDLAAKTATTTYGTPAGAIFELEDGWFRCFVKATPTLLPYGFFLGLLDATGERAFVGDGIKGIFLRKAQFQQVAPDSPAIPDHYVATTAAPLSNGVGPAWFDFDNSNDYLMTPIAPASDGYFCCAARLDSDLTSTDYIFGAFKTTATIQAGVGLRVSSTTGLLAMQRTGADGTLTTVTTSTAVSIGVPFVADCGWGAALGEVRLNGAGEGTSSSSKDAANPNTAFMLGSANTGTAAAPILNGPFGGAIFLAGYIPSVPTAAQQATIRKLMAQIAGVPGVV